MGRAPPRGARSRRTASARQRPWRASPPPRGARAVVQCVEAGAKIVNLSLTLTPSPSRDDHRRVREALDHAYHRGAVVVAAAGNQRMIGGSS
ncbi:S8 family serine peptidase [Nonomuraea sp. NPDC046802]|uniref:S8 family serine peptidase n=1 Tax=Nonomuraea sp. NPDC046802 TaxID=3154919 RepID=UPI0033D83AFD